MCRDNAIACSDRSGFTLIELLVVIAIIALLISFLLGGGVWPLQAIWYVLAGWGYFILRKVPKAEPEAEAVVTGVAAFLLLAFLLHLLMRHFVNRPAAEITPARNWSPRTTAALAGVIVMLFAAGVSAIGITHQSLWLATTDEARVQSRGSSVREAARQSLSQNNLKEIGVGLHIYQQENNAMPQATTFDASGRQMHGWQTHLLPYIEQDTLFKTIDLHRPWNDPANHKAFSEEVPIYCRPLLNKHDEAGYALSMYSANVHAWSSDQPRRLEDFPRGASNTLLVGEAQGNWKPWGHPLNVRDPRLGLHKSPDGFGGPLPGRTQFLMADGSVRVFTKDADPEFLELIGH